MNNRPHSTPRSHTSRRLAWVFVALLLVALNLRLAITSASALLTALTESGALSSATVVLIPAIPTAVFAVAGLGTPKLAARYGVDRMVLLGLAALAAGLLIRAIAHPWIVVAGTVIGTGGLAMVNILLPAVVRAYFPHRIGPVTTAYTTLMSLGAALAAALAVPVATGLGSPSLGLGAWAVPAIVALIVWGLATRVTRDRGPIPQAPIVPTTDPVDTVAAAATAAATAAAAAAESAAGTSPQATTESGTPATPARRGFPRGTWWLAGYFALQALLSYVVMGWLPTIASDAGLSPERSGMLLGISMAIGVVGTILVMLLGRTASGMRVGFGLVAASNIVALLGLLAAPAALPELWAALLGFGMCAFPLVLALIAGFGRDAHESARVSGVVQSVGYSVATVGPLGAGAARQLFGSWDAVLITLVVGTVAQFVIGVLVSRVVEQRRAAAAKEESGGVA